MIRPFSRAHRLPAAFFAAAAVATIGGCRRGPERPSAQAATLLRQNAGLETLLRAAERGPLVPPDDVLVIVDESLVERALQAAIPYERVIGDRFKVRVTGATVRFDDGVALVRLEGTASLAATGEAAARAVVSVVGGFDVVDFDPASGVLRGRVQAIGVEARQVAVLGMEAPGRQLVEDIGRERLEAFEALVSRIEIPVRLDREIALPGFGPEGGITIAPATIPVAIALDRLVAYRGKLWIAIKAGARAPKAAR